MVDAIGSAGGLSDDSNVLASRSVLVCEDESLIRLYLVDLLEELGYKVFEAANGGGALEQLSQTHIDLLITDMGLPDMSGGSLAERVRAIKPDLPVLFATGRDRDDSVLVRGLTGYLAKPFTMQSLQVALSALFSTPRIDGS